VAALRPKTFTFTSGESAGFARVTALPTGSGAYSPFEDVESIVMGSTDSRDMGPSCHHG
jgi:hypothetical protein